MANWLFMWVSVNWSVAITEVFRTSERGEGMRDFWIVLLMWVVVLIVVGIIGSCIVFISKVWEYINLPRTTLIIKDLPVGGINLHWEGHDKTLEVRHEEKEKI